MRTFILTHEHKYGESVYPLESKEDLTESANNECPPSETLEKVIKALKIDFEPELDEYINIVEVEGGALNVDEL